MKLVYVVSHVESPDWETGEIRQVKVFDNPTDALKYRDERDAAEKWGWHIVVVEEVEDDYQL